MVRDKDINEAKIKKKGYSDVIQSLPGEVLKTNFNFFFVFLEIHSVREDALSCGAMK